MMLIGLIVTFWMKKDLGFESNRELEEVELVAKFYENNEGGCELLFISDKISEKLFERSKLCQTK